MTAADRNRHPHLCGCLFRWERKEREIVYYTGTMVQVLVMVMMPMIRALMIPAM